MTAKKTGEVSRGIAVGGLVLFVSLLFVVPLVTVLADLLPPRTPIHTRAIFALVAACLLLLAVGAYLKAWSVLWQIPLQASALAFLVVGIRTTVSLLFDDRHRLFEPIGGVGVGYLVAGVMQALLMKRLEVRFLRPHHRRPARRSVRSPVADEGGASAQRHAKRRAARRKSPWNLLLLLIVPLWLVLWWSLAGAGCLISFVFSHREIHAEDRNHPGTDYMTAQRTLGRITLYTLPVALLLLLIGAWLQ